MAPEAARRQRDLEERLLRTLAEATRFLPGRLVDALEHICAAAQLVEPIEGRASTLLSIERFVLQEYLEWFAAEVQRRGTDADEFRFNEASHAAEYLGRLLIGSDHETTVHELSRDVDAWIDRTLSHVCARYSRLPKEEQDDGIEAFVEALFSADSFDEVLRAATAGWQRRWLLVCLLNALALLATAEWFSDYEDLDGVFWDKDRYVADSVESLLAIGDLLRLSLFKMRLLQIAAERQETFATVLLRDMPEDSHAAAGWFAVAALNYRDSGSPRRAYLCGRKALRSATRWGSLSDVECLRDVIFERRGAKLRFAQLAEFEARYAAGEARVALQEAERETDLSKRVDYYERYRQALEARVPLAEIFDAVVAFESMLDVANAAAEDDIAGDYFVRAAMTALDNPTVIEVSPRDLMRSALECYVAADARDRKRGSWYRAKDLGDTASFLQEHHTAAEAYDRVASGVNEGDLRTPYYAALACQERAEAALAERRMSQARAELAEAVKHFDAARRQALADRREVEAETPQHKWQWSYRYDRIKYLRETSLRVQFRSELAQNRLEFLAALAAWNDDAFNEATERFAALAQKYRSRLRSIDQNKASLGARERGVILYYAQVCDGYALASQLLAAIAREPNNRTGVENLLDGCVTAFHRIELTAISSHRPLAKSVVQLLRSARVELAGLGPTFAATFVGELQTLTQPTVSPFCPLPSQANLTVVLEGANGLRGTGSSDHPFIVTAETVVSLRLAVDAAFPTGYRTLRLRPDFDQPLLIAASSDVALHPTTDGGRVIKGVQLSVRFAQVAGEASVACRVAGAFVAYDCELDYSSSIDLDIRFLVTSPSATATAAQVFVDDIDSFAAVRSVSPEAIAGQLQDGRIEALEDDVQFALERALSQTFHRADHGGEEADLFASTLVLRGQRVPTAFLLKGRGVRRRELTIADCGKNGDQIVRLFQVPASLYVIQYVGPISDNVIKDVAGKVRERRAAGEQAAFCVIDGSDTARLLHAFQP